LDIFLAVKKQTLIPAHATDASELNAVEKILDGSAETTDFANFFPGVFSPIRDFLTSARYVRYMDPPM
jgi:hypothetical protein